jgi:hypothetical protein
MTIQLVNQKRRVRAATARLHGCSTADLHNISVQIHNEKQRLLDLKVQDALARLGVPNLFAEAR